MHKFRRSRYLPAVPHRKVVTMPGPFSFDRPSDRLFFLPSRHGMEELSPSSENLEACARLEATLNELIAAEARLDEELSHPATTDSSYALDQVRIARSQCDAAAVEVLKSAPKTDLEKKIKREVIAVYLKIVNLDQLELFAILGPKLLSQRENDLPVAPTSSPRARSSLWTARLRIGLNSSKSSKG